MLQTNSGFPQDSPADQGQRCSQDQRGRRFDPGVTVRVRRIGRVRALPGGIDDQKIGKEIGERMQAVGDQRLRVADPADQNLSDGHQQVHGDADPCRPLRLRSTVARR